MTERTIIEDIILKAEGGRVSDDHLLDYDQVRFWVNSWRARFIKEFVEKRLLISNFFVQDLGCIELVCVDKADCCGSFLVYESYKKLKTPLPAMVDMGGYIPITFVGLIDKVTKIPVLDPYYVQYAKYAKYTGKKRRSFLIDNQLYFDLPPNDNLSVVNVRAVLFDPKDVNVFSDCGGCYDDMNDPYPIAADMIQRISQSIMEVDLAYSLKTEGINDRRNDSMDTKVSNAE
jgi:hypothetical protein